ncbi:MAG: ABC transporter permease, partial [Muribaculaceae bacterium]|nr:ABC transporter permease [Muribaculaceae bacterium]
MKKKFQQIFYDMRRRPVITGITLTGTAAAMFLLMVFIMMQAVETVPFAPESCRDRILYGRYIDARWPGGSKSMSGSLNFDQADEIYSGLEGIEKMCHVDAWTCTNDAIGPSGTIGRVTSRLVDSDFWDIFDFNLVSGRYFTADEADAGMSVMVINSSTARHFFGSPDSAPGKILNCSDEDYRVTGVVEDVSPLATQTYAQVYTPVSRVKHFGTGDVALLMKKGVSKESIQRQVEKRYDAINARRDSVEEGYYLYHGQPYDQKTVSGDVYSNWTPESSAIDWTTILLCVILLVVPAINLSTMLTSRLRSSLSEYGIRRAYGCTRCRIFADIVSENMILTLFGGLIGIVLAIIFVYNSGSIFAFIGDSTEVSVTPPLSLLISWQVVLLALVACLILNLLSACVPAWKAARTAPVESI